MADPIYVIDLFAGAGGFSSGVHMAGHKVILCVEYWDKGLAIHHANFPDCIHVKMALGGDVADFVAELKHFVEKALPPGAKWHLHGSPPCQSFSIAQRQNKNHDVETDARSNLTKWYFDVLEGLDPPRWSFEQVPGVLKYISKHVPWVLEKKDVNIYPACYGYEFGAPTMRKRLYIGKGWSFDDKTTAYGSKKRRRCPEENNLSLHQTNSLLCDAVVAELNADGARRYDGLPFTVEDVAIKTSANKWVTSRKEREKDPTKKNKWVPAPIGQGLRCISKKPQFATIASYALQYWKRVSNNVEDAHPIASHLDGRWSKHRDLKPSELAAIQSFPIDSFYRIDDLKEHHLVWYASLKDVNEDKDPATTLVTITNSARIRGVGNAVVSKIAKAMFVKS